MKRDELKKAAIDWAVIVMLLTALGVLITVTAYGQTYQIGVPQPPPIAITVACPGGAAAAQVGNSFVCPGVTPPPTGCVGFSKTINLTMDWNNPQRLYTSSQGGMGANDVVVVAFTTGSVMSPDNNLPRIVGAEYQGPPVTRIAALSDKPCDFTGLPYSGATTSGTTVTIPFTVANPNNYGYYAILNKTTQYYYNVKNAPNGTCVSVGICNMAFDLNKNF